MHNIPQTGGDGRCRELPKMLRPLFRDVSKGDGVRLFLPVVLATVEILVGNKRAVLGRNRGSSGRAHRESCDANGRRVCWEVQTRGIATHQSTTHALPGSVFNAKVTGQVLRVS